MRIVHLSDTHLGFSAYRAIEKNLGINQRESDINKAFAQAIEKIISLKPQVVLHSGDLFDSVRPSNRIISFCLEQLLKVSQAGIPVVMIAGNHSTPRIRGTGSIFRIFSLFENFYPIYKGEYETATFNGLTIHAIPQCPTKEEFEKELQKLNSSRFLPAMPEQGDGRRGTVHGSRFNVLMLHAGIAEIKEFSMGEFNEQIVPLSLLEDGFDYVALGHYHRFVEVKENIYYSGSTERFSFNETGQEKGFLEVDLRTKKANFHPLEIRPMVDLSLEADGLSAEVLMKKIEKTLGENGTQNKIVRLTLNNIRGPTYESLDFHSLRKLTAPALHFELKFTRPDEESYENLNSPQIGGLLSEWAEFVKKAPDLKKKQDILKLGLSYLERVGETPPPADGI